MGHVANPCRHLINGRYAAFATPFFFADGLKGDALPFIGLENLDSRRIFSGGPEAGMYPRVVNRADVRPAVIPLDPVESDPIDPDSLEDFVAGEPIPMPPPYRAADTDSDGVVSYAEQYALVKAGKIPAIDVNEDGAVDIRDHGTPIFSASRPELFELARRDKAEVENYKKGYVAVFSDGRVVVMGDPVSVIREGNPITIKRSSKYLNVTVNGQVREGIPIKKAKRIELYGSGVGDHITLENIGVPIAVYAVGGNDTIYGSDNAETNYGGDGDDQIHGGGGDDVIAGVNGNDRLWGDSGNDRLEGGAGKDRLDGGSGIDKLAGGGGTDYLTIRPKDKRDSDRTDKVTILK